MLLVFIFFLTCFRNIYKHYYYVFVGENGLGYNPGLLSMAITHVFKYALCGVKSPTHFGIVENGLESYKTFGKIKNEKEQISVDIYILSVVFNDLLWENKLKSLMFIFACH